MDSLNNLNNNGDILTTKKEIGDDEKVLGQSFLFYLIETLVNEEIYLQWEGVSFMGPRVRDLFLTRLLQKLRTCIHYEIQFFV